MSNVSDNGYIVTYLIAWWSLISTLSKCILYRYTKCYWNEHISYYSLLTVPWCGQPLEYTSPCTSRFEWVEERCWAVKVMFIIMCMSFDSSSSTYLYCSIVVAIYERWSVISFIQYTFNCTLPEVQGILLCNEFVF